MRTFGLFACLAVVAAGGVFFFVGYRDSDERAFPLQRVVKAGEFSAVNSVMTGLWKSVDDENYTREFKKNGIVLDKYVGEPDATDAGLYVAIDPRIVTVPGVPTENLLGITVLKISFSKIPEPLFFSINALDSTNLTMTYLEGTGKPLTFTKVR